MSDIRLANLSLIPGLSRSGIEMACNTILVDEEFRTNDPDIYAVGSFVKMTTPVNYQHTYTSAEEMAAKVGYCHIDQLHSSLSNHFSSPSHLSCCTTWACGLMDQNLSTATRSLRSIRACCHWATSSPR